MNDIDDYDVFDGMRWLLLNNVDLDDQLAVERALWTPLYCAARPALKERFIKCCAQAARLNKESFGSLGPSAEYFGPGEDALRLNLATEGARRGWPFFELFNNGIANRRSIFGLATASSRAVADRRHGTPRGLSEARL